MRKRKFGERGKSAFARAIGVAATTYDKYEAGSVPNALILGRMIRSTGCSADWLLYGDGEMFSTRRAEPDRRDAIVVEYLRRQIAAVQSEGAEQPDPPDLSTFEAQFVYLPLYADPAAAGQPRAIQEHEIDGAVPVPLDMCPHPKDTSCIRVRGDSMAPTLAEDTIVAVDAAIKRLDVLDGKIVCVRNSEDDGVTIKRLVLRGSVARFQPDNPAYVGLEVPAAEVEDNELIVGKVVWSWTAFE